MHLIFGGEPRLMRHVDPIFKVAETNKDAGQAIKECVGYQPRRFERLPTGFQQQPLMWIHDARLARRNAEKGRIKGVNAL